MIRFEGKGITGECSAIHRHLDVSAVYEQMFDDSGAGPGPIPTSHTPARFTTRHLPHLIHEYSHGTTSSDSPKGAQEAGNKGPSAIQSAADIKCGKWRRG